MSGVTLSEDGIVTGNTYDKYGSSNPVVRRLMSSFERSLAANSAEPLGPVSKLASSNLKKCMIWA